MKSSPYPALAEWLRERMQRPYVAVQKLSEAVGIPEATLRSYIAGQRKPTDALKRHKIAEALKREGESVPEVEASMEVALQQIKTRRDFYRDLGAESLVLKTMTLLYEPFANGKDRFVDRFFERFFRLSVIRRERIGKHIRFELRKRLKMLDCDDYQIATNLLGTLPRLKQSFYYWFPIRLSIGAVCLRRHAGSLPQIAKTLTFPNVQRPAPLWPVVVDFEVGAIHVQQSLGIDLSGEPSHFADDLDPKKLIARLREQDGVEGNIACIVTDEVTALAVARELGDEALIVFPLTTVKSVETSHFRRELPAHFMGAAVSRKNRELREYLDDAWPAFLRWEQETIVSSYTGLFGELTDYVRDCLKHGASLANVNGRADNLSTMENETRELFVYRLAVSYARRTLQIDRQSIEFHRHSGSPWWKILERARERILVKDAENRLFVRRRVCMMFEQAFGQGFPTLLTGPQLRSLMPLLEEEFDVELVEREWVVAEGSGGDGRPAQQPSVETLTSAIQRAMERSSVVALHTNVSEARIDQGKILRELRSELSEELEEDANPVSEGGADEKRQMSFLAVYRGEFVGCVDIDSVDRENYQLRNLYVRQTIRGHGVGRILIRAALEHVSAVRANGVVIDLVRVGRKSELRGVEEFFEQNGFRRSSKDEPLKYTPGDTGDYPVR